MNEELKRKVQIEYVQGFNHIRAERDRKRNILQKLLPTNIPDGQVRVNLLWKNLQLERALFIQDKMNIKVISNNTILGQEIMRNAEKVFTFDDRDMDLVNMREDIVDNNWLYWVAITAVDNYDEDEQQPISDTISPLSVIPDPKNWRWSKMRFIWFERRLSLDFIQNAPWFKNQKLIENTATSQELRLNDEANASANRTTNITEQEWLIDVYDHYTTYKGKKVLTTWANNKELCIRYIEIEALSKTEQLQPNKIKFPVQIHRRKNKPWSFFWVSIADEILQYQDAISVLTNLQLHQARLVWLWPDKYINNNLWIDFSILNQRKPWWRVIPVQNMGNQNVWNAIYTDQHPNPSQFPSQMSGQLENYSKETTWAWDITYWQSQSWSQTKAEIQTLMQNSNQLLSAIADNYFRGQRDYWEAHYRSYALNMWTKDKKVISLYQKWNALSLEMQKQDFIADWKVQVVIESQNQIDKENEKNSAKLLALQGVYLQFIQWDFARNEFLRKMWEAQWITDFDAEVYIELTADELRARDNLELLNRNEEVAPPQVWEDFRTYLSIYSQALDTEAKFDAVFNYRQAIINEKMMAWMWWGEWEEQMQGWNNQTANMAMNMINQDQQANKNPSLQDISM